MVCTTSFITLYLPFYSDAAQSKRHAPVSSSGGSRGSMWSNIAKVRDSKDD